MMYECGLILEGGGMRGLYTAGVLDFFQDMGIYFTSCYGVSAGAVNGLNYLAKQRGRMYRVNVDYLEEKEYASFHNLVTTGNYFGTEMCYHRIPDELNPIDYETFKQYPGKYYVVATDCLTGQPKYIRITDLKKQLNAIRASCSLPLLASMVKIDGRPCLDGGMSDSIPVRQSVRDGNRKNIIILTRDAHYQKKPNELLPVIKVRYRHYPKLIEAMKTRHIEYNRTIRYIQKQEKQGNVFVIRPEREITIGRLEKDKEKLTQLYQQGYEEAKKKYEKIMMFLNDTESIGKRSDE